MEKIIIDTNIGDDIDDALAISFAVRSDEIEVIGVSTVYKNVEKRARLARCLLDAAQRSDIPVYKGIGNPLVEKVDLLHNLPQYWDEMDAFDIETEIDAIDFMADMIRKNPGEITIVSIGPLTNIAVLLLKNPELVNKIKCINFMGGAYYNLFSEFNIKRDPEAAKFVFDSGVPIKAIGLDVTTRCVLSQEYFDKFINIEDSFVQFQIKLIEKWRLSVPWRYPCLHDPLAVFSVFDADTIEYEEKYVDIELHGEFTRGMTITHDQNRYLGIDGYHEKNTALLAKTVDVKKFVDIFAERAFGV